MGPATAKVKHDEADHVVIENNHPAIIDPKLFDTVQRKMTERQRATTPKVNGGEFLLTGLVRCAKCGGKMSGRNGRKDAQYMCNNHGSRGTCDNNTTGQAPLVECIVGAIEEQLLDPTTIKLVRERITRLVKKAGKESSVTKLKKELAAINSKMVKARRRLVEVDSDMLTVVQESIREFQDKKTDLESAIETASMLKRQQVSAEVAKIDSAMRHFSELRETLESGDQTKMRELLRESVKSVDVMSVRESGKYQLRRGVIHLIGAEPNNLFTLS